jgi:hypothetical protein
MYLGTNNTIMITVEDTSLDSDVGPYVYIEYNGEERQVNMTRTVIPSRWVAFIANNTFVLNSANNPKRSAGAAAYIGGTYYAFVDDPYADAILNNSNVPADPPAATWSQGNFTVPASLEGQVNYEDRWPVVQLYVLTDGTGFDELTVHYYDRGESITIDVEETVPEITEVDRTSIPPNATVSIMVEDPTANIDPTAEEDYTNPAWSRLAGFPPGANFTYANYTLNLLVNGINKTDHINNISDGLPGSPFGRGGRIAVLNGTETDDTTGVFNITLNMSWFMFRQFGDTRNWTMEHGDVWEIVLKKYVLEDNLQYGEWESTSWEFIIKITDAVVDTETPEISYSGDEWEIMLTDSDYNLNNYAEETVNVTYYAGSGMWPENITLEETAHDSGKYVGTLTIQLGNMTGITINGNGTDALTVWLSPDEAEDFELNITYRDPIFRTLDYSEQNFEMAIYDHTLSWDKESYPKTDETATVTVNSPDFNDDPEKRDVINLTTVGGTDMRADLTHVQRNVPLGYLALEVEDGFYNLGAGGNLTINGGQLLETGKNTGKFSWELDLNDAVEPGDEMILHIYNIIVDDNATATASIGGEEGMLSTDRDRYGVSPMNTTIIYATLEDDDKNENPYKVEWVKVGVRVYNGTGLELGLEDSNIVQLIGGAAFTQLEETGKDTGVFEGEIKYQIFPTWINFTLQNKTGDWPYILHYDSWTTVAPGRELVNGKVVLNYTDPLAQDDEVELEVDIRAHQATLDVNVSKANMRDPVELTLKHPDDNLDSDDIDTVTLGFVMDDDLIANNLTLRETGDNTGIFKGTIIIDEPKNFTVDPDDTVTFNFTDTATAASYIGTALERTTVEWDLYIVPHDAKVWLNADEYGPFSFFNITLYDPDYANNETFTIGTEKEQGRLYVATSLETFRNIPANNTYPNGTATWKLQLNKTVGGAVSLMYPITAPNDTLYVYFYDDVGADGEEAVLLQTEALIRSHTGIITLDKPTYNVDDWVNITVTDIDKNSDPDRIETFTVTAKSETWPVGQDIALSETDDDTAIFTGLCKLTDEIPTGNRVKVQLGDTLKVIYEDDWNAAAEEQDIKATALIGEAILYPVPATDLEIIDPISGETTTPTVGVMVIITANITNEGLSTHDFTYIVQVKKDNVVEHLGLVTGTIEPEQSLQPGVSWTPLETGTYTVEIFVWKSLTEPEAYSPVLTTTVIVE